MSDASKAVNQILRDLEQLRRLHPAVYCDLLDYQYRYHIIPYIRSGGRADYEDETSSDVSGVEEEEDNSFCEDASWVGEDPHRNSDGKPAAEY